MYFKEGRKATMPWLHTLSIRCDTVFQKVTSKASPTIPGKVLAASPGTNQSPGHMSSSSRYRLKWATYAPLSLALSMYSAAGKTRADVPTTSRRSTCGTDSNHSSIRASMSNGSCSPNQTTPGRWRLDLHFGQWGSSSTVTTGSGTAGWETSQFGRPKAGTLGKTLQLNSVNVQAWSKHVVLNRDPCIAASLVASCPALWDNPGLLVSWEPQANGSHTIDVLSNSEKMRFCFCQLCKCDVA